MGCCDSSTQLGRDGGIFRAGAGVAEGHASARPGTRASGAEAPEVETTFTAGRKPRPSLCGFGNSVDQDAAGNSVRARKVLEIDDLRAMNSPTTGQRSTGTWLLLLLVRFYRIFFSSFLGGACKFYPSCSRYAQEAIAAHGARRGGWLAMKRLGRCRPFTKGGFDPVPELDAATGADGRTRTQRPLEYLDADWLRTASKERAQ